MRHHPSIHTIQMLALALLLSGCATTQKSAGFVAPTSTASPTTLPAGVYYTTTWLQETPFAKIKLGPVGRYKIGPSALDLGLGLEVAARRDDEFATPGIRLGFDAVNMGCTTRTCFGGTGGVHGAIDIPLTETTGQHVMIEVALDHDIRIGPLTTTSFLVGVRFIPKFGLPSSKD